MRSLADWIARVVLARPWITIGVTLLVCLAAMKVASGLDFDTRFDALLRDEAPELQEVRELQRRAGGTVQLVLALRGDPETRLQFAREAVAKLRQQPFVQYAHVEYPVSFFKERRVYFLSLKKLRRIEARVQREIDRARARANPLYVDLEDDDDDQAGKKEKAGAGWDELERKERRVKQAFDLKRTLQSPDGRYLFARIKPRGTSYDMAAGEKLLGKIRAVVEGLEPQKRGLSYRFAGTLALNVEQHKRMNADLRVAAVLALFLILGLMTLHIRQLVAPLVLALPLLTGVAITLALTKIFIGQLNLVSGFLVSALIGLGIDYEIHLYLRYLEVLSQGHDREQAIRIAIRKTLNSCTTAALTTAAAFFAIAVANFRGFREYGLIAGTGVLITLATSFLALPPLAVLLSRRGKRGLRIFSGSRFRRGFALSMVFVGTGLLIFSFTVAGKVRWHSNFRELRGTSETVNFTKYVEDVTGGSLSPAGIYVQNIAQARAVERFIKPLTKSAGSSMERTVSLATMLPADLAEKGKILAKLRRSLQKLAQEKLKPEDKKRVDRALELTRHGPWTLEEIPEVFKQPFSTVDGKGQFVLLWPRTEMVEDTDIIAWGGEINRIRADLHSRGIPVKILGENRIGARVLGEMRSDAPVIIIAAIVAVLLILLTDTRSPRAVLLIGGSLGVGVAWMLGVMYLVGLEINVFNQAVLATIIGLGLDNAVHMQHRYAEEGHGSLPKVVATTGAASFLATATTAIGFGAAVTASHYGVQSLGWLALVGFTTTFISSTVFFPAVLRLLECAAPEGCGEQYGPSES